MAREPQALTCSICKRPLGIEGDPSSFDCGGDCLRCMAHADDPDCVVLMDVIDPAWREKGKES